MSIVVTGATGKFGGLVVSSLIDQGIDPAGITAVGRNEAKLNELASLGVTTAKADYGDSASLDKAFADAGKVLLVSGDELGLRVKLHEQVIDAAVRHGVSLVAYTSVLHADTSPLAVADDHRATEAYLRNAGGDVHVAAQRLVHGELC